MKRLTRIEEMIMLAILNLKDDAYLVAITDFLKNITEERVLLTSVHLPLSRLEKEGLLSSEFGEATAVRGGRRKKIYRVTKAGFAALEEHRKITETLWAAFPEYSGEMG
jgi:PadR family transcriptional regulator PadR